MIIYRLGYGPSNSRIELGAEGAKFCSWVSKASEVHRLVYLPTMLRTMRDMLIRPHETGSLEIQMCMSRLYKMINSSSGYREDCSHCPGRIAVLVTIKL